MKIDGRELANRRRAAGISQRALARETGQTATTVAYLERTGDVTHLSCGALDRVCRALGTTLSAVCAEGAEDEVSLDADVAAGLVAAAEGLSTDTLAVVLDVRVEAVEAAGRRLSERLRPVGVGVTSAAGRLRLISLPRTTLTDGSLAAAERRIRLRRRLDSETVLLVYRVWRGAGLADLVPDEHKRWLDAGALLNGCFLDGAADGGTGLSEDVRYSLMLR